MQIYLTKKHLAVPALSRRSQNVSGPCTPAELQSLNSKLPLQDAREFSDFSLSPFLIIKRIYEGCLTGAVYKMLLVDYF